LITGRPRHRGSRSERAQGPGVPREQREGQGRRLPVPVPGHEPVDPTTDATPPIVGLTNPPDPVPDANKSPKGPFEITLVGVDVEDVRELWVEGYRYVGSAHAKGDLALAQEISVTGHLDMPTGQMMRGNDVMIDSLEGEIGGTLAGIIRGQPITREVLAGFDAKVNVAAKTDDLSFVNYYLQAAPWLKLDGAAELDVDVTIDNGEYALGSLVNAHTTDMVVDFFAYEIRGDGTVRMEVVTGDDGPETHMGVNYGDFMIQEIAAAAPPAVVPDTPEGAAAPTAAAAAEPLVVGHGFELTAMSPDNVVGRPLMNMNVLVEIPESTVPDVKRFDHYMPTRVGVGIRGGSGALAGHFTASTSDGQLSGRVDLTGNDVAVTLDHLLITTDLALHAQLVGGAGTGIYDFSGTSLKVHPSRHARHAAREGARGGEHPADVVVDADRDEGTVEVGAPNYLDARLTLRCANSEPFIRVLAQKKSLPGWVQNTLDVPDVEGDAHIKIGTDALTVNPFNVAGGQLEVKARLFRRGTSNTGAMYARYGKLTSRSTSTPATRMSTCSTRRTGTRAKTSRRQEAKDAKDDAKVATTKRRSPSRTGRRTRRRTTAGTAGRQASKRDAAE
jgi:hypothetical protein